MLYDVFLSSITRKTMRFIKRSNKKVPGYRTFWGNISLENSSQEMYNNYISDELIISAIQNVKTCACAVFLFWLRFRFESVSFCSSTRETVVRYRQQWIVTSQSPPTPFLWQTLRASVVLMKSPRKMPRKTAVRWNYLETTWLESQWISQKK